MLLSVLVANPDIGANRKETKTMDINEKNKHFAVLAILLREKKNGKSNDRLDSAFKSSLRSLEDDYYERNYDKEKKKWKHERN